jgi:hypothetical protein
LKRHSVAPSADATSVSADGALSADLAQMCERLSKLHAHAASLGLFTNDRELLACPSCGLQDDVTIEGILITHDIESVDVSDSGLRFTERQDGHYSCPRCGADVVAGESAVLAALIVHGEEQVAEGKFTPVGEVGEVGERLRQRR